MRRREASCLSGRADVAQSCSEWPISRSRANIRHLEHVVSQRTVLAPVSGRPAQVNDVQVGAVLESGTRLDTIVPAGDLRVVARFPAPSALDRLQPGQPAWLRLELFPWTRHGRLQRGDRRGDGPWIVMALLTRCPALTIRHGKTTIAVWTMPRVIVKRPAKA